MLAHALYIVRVYTRVRVGVGVHNVSVEYMHVPRTSVLIALSCAC